MISMPYRNDSFGPLVDVLNAMKSQRDMSLTSIIQKTNGNTGLFPVVIQKAVDAGLAHKTVVYEKKYSYNITSKGVEFLKEFEYVKEKYGLSAFIQSKYKPT